MEAKLFTPYTIKNVTLKNRIVMSPMCMYSCSKEDGKIESFHFTHYVSRAIGQVGLIMQEATAVSPEGRISKRDIGIWDDEHIEGLTKLVEEVKAYGAKIGIQLAHAGRKSEVDGEIIAPSPLPFNEQSKKPKEMTTEEIKTTIEAFKKGAERAKEAGYDIIEIHGAHGYLINEFLSPLTNKRTDDYGGEARNRYRFLQEIIHAVKEVWDGPLFVRVSAHEYNEHGLTADDYITIAKWMKEDGVDLIDVSSGGVVPAKIPVFPGYQVSFSDTIKNKANINTGAVGIITSGKQAEDILANNQADLIFVGRELLRDPYFPRRAASELNVKIDVPVQYERGWM